MSIRRRDFLKKATQVAASAAGAAVVAAGCRDRQRSPADTGAAAAAPAEPFEIIDSHIHVWDRGILNLPWLAGAGPPLNRDFSTADYAQAAAGLNLRRAVYVEVAVVPEQRTAEAEWVQQLCRGAGPAGPDARIAAAVIGGSPGAGDFRDYITRFKNDPCVRGVRETLRPGSGRDPRFLAGVRLLGDLGLGFDLLADPDTLADAAELARQCPRTPMILDHCGNPGPALLAADPDAAQQARRERWRRGIAELAARPNVSCKISGVAEGAGAKDPTAADLAPVVDYCLDAFGPDRVMFGSNWPVCLTAVTLRRWVELLTEITARRGAGFRRKLFAENAERVYRLGHRGAHVPGSGFNRAPARSVRRRGRFGGHGCTPTGDPDSNDQVSEPRERTSRTSKTRLS